MFRFHRLPQKSSALKARIQKGWDQGKGPQAQKILFDVVV